MKKIMKVLCVFLSVLLVVLCTVLVMLIMNNGSPSASVTKTEYEKSTYRQYFPDENTVKLIGRSSYSDGKVCFSYSGSGLEYICKGAYTEITVCAENPYAFSSNNKPRFAIYSDGNLIVDECISVGEKTYRIDTDYNGTTITFIKLSEAMHSSLSVSSITSYGMEDIYPSEEKDLKIEFIGDSITCGYGIDGGYIGSFKTETENFTKTYAYLTAKNLDADYSAICFSGYGVVSGYTENGYKTDALVMNEYGKACLLSGQEYLWDFSKAHNDLVVINLGTNDASYCSGSYSRRQEFIQSYKDMLRTVREKNPDAYILCILGDMNNSLYSSIEAAVGSYSSEAGDYRTEAYTISYKMGENDIVINGHPGEKSNICASEELTLKIRELIRMGKVG